MKRILASLTTIAILASALPAPVFASDCYVDPVLQYAGSGTIKSGVFLRDQACMTGSSVIKTISAGTAVQVIGFTDGWYRVEVGGSRGWLGQQFVQTGAQLTGVTWSSYQDYMSEVPSKVGTIPTPTPSPSPTTETLYTGSINPRDLIKLACSTKAKSDDACRAVYYLGADGKRHAFPNSETYFSWYPNFDNVRVISTQQMGQYTLGQNVTFRPGKLMVKFTTDPKTYAVAKGGVLRWVNSEELAIALYGQTWNKSIRDIADTFYTNYTFGTDILSANDYNPTSELSQTITLD
ncbi:MAG: SH3 domain-containing protein [Candidatus Uhrbacteria bacterium]